MKTLFKDPVGWAKRMAGSRRMMIYMIFLQFLLATNMYLFGVMCVRMERLHYLVGMIFLTVVCFPAMYIYGMFRLVKRVDELEELLKERGRSC